MEHIDTILFLLISSALAWLWVRSQPEDTHSQKGCREAIAVIYCTIAPPVAFVMLIMEFWK